MKLQLIAVAAASALILAGCGASKDDATSAKPAQANKVAPQEVRAPAPPPPPGGGKPAPEIPPEILAKIRADLAKNPPAAAPAAASAATSASVQVAPAK